MKYVLAQINTTPGAFANNLNAILKGIQAAKEANADMVVFPELAIPGYLTQDLMYDPSYMEANFNSLREVCLASTAYKGYVVVGHLGYSRAGVGKRFTNSASVIHSGVVVGSYDKQLLPFYDVFHEARWFEAGKNACILDILGRRIGILICEDVWNDKGDFTYTYANNPIAKYRELGVNTIISLNSSPWVQGKAWQRYVMLNKAIEGSIEEIVYVNQCGGQDDLVFDGSSFVVKKQAHRSAPTLIHFCQDPFRNTYEVANMSIHDALADSRSETYFANSFEPKLKDMLVLSTRDYIHKNGFKEAVFGSSGGADSAVVGMILADALQPENVHSISMPTSISSDHSKDDAENLSKSLGIHYYTVPILHQKVLAEYNHDLADFFAGRIYQPVADENIQARLRDVVLMHASNGVSGVLPIATGNKTEAAVGYYTHFDMCLGFAPIKDVYKMQVLAMAKADNRIPQNIWQKKPSAELSENQTDEASLLPYPILDAIVKAYIEHYISNFLDFSNWALMTELDAVNNWTGTDNAHKDYRRIIKLIMINEFKRWQTCVGTKVTPVAFGSGRRIPISKGWLP